MYTEIKKDEQIRAHHKTRAKPTEKQKNWDPINRQRQVCSRPAQYVPDVFLASDGIMLNRRKKM